MSRPTFQTIRAMILLERGLEDGWLTASEVCDRLGHGHGTDWLRVALVCERLAHEGVLELQNPSSRGKRYFRRAA